MSEVYHNPLLVERYSAFVFCRKPTLQDTSAILDIHPGRPSIYYKIFQEEHYHWRHLYTMLKRKSILVLQEQFFQLSSLSHDASGTLQHFEANRMHAYLHCKVTLQHSAVLLQFHSNTSNILYMMFHDQICRTTNRSAQC